MRKRLSNALLSMTALAVLSVAPARAQDSANRQAALILRILSYDRNLTQRATERVTILVLHPPGAGAHEAERRRVTDAINGLGQRATVARMHARAVPVPFTGRAALVQRARSEGAAAIYVCSGLESSTPDVSAAARETHMLSLTPDAASVRRGLSVGLVERGAEVQLLVNLRAVEAEGARLDATVLRLAEVIR